MILIFLGELDFSEAYGAKRKKKMKFDEQDRVRNHALGFYLAFFFGNTTHLGFLTKPTRTERVRQKRCIPYEKVCIHFPRRGKLMSRNYAVIIYIHPSFPEERDVLLLSSSRGNTTKCYLPYY